LFKNQISFDSVRGCKTFTVYNEIDQYGKVNNNVGWKDTVLVSTWSTVDILLVADNPGLWHMHCHIAEHLGAGMETVVKVI
jgi:FtsP/CotA-like multicopper oxidase with cupredoxin domain